MTPNRDATYARVLVVDDNDLIHGLFRTIFGAGAPSTSGGGEDRGESSAAEPGRRDHQRIEVDSARQEAEAVDRLRRAEQAGRRYAVAFVDVEVPSGWDGLETISRLWDVDPGLEVVICSGSWDESWSARVNQLERRKQLHMAAKPFDIAALRSLTQELIEKRRLSSQPTLIHAG